MTVILRRIQDILREREFERRLEVTPPGSVRDDMLIALQNSHDH